MVRGGSRAPRCVGVPPAWVLTRRGGNHDRGRPIPTLSSSVSTTGMNNVICAAGVGGAHARGQTVCAVPGSRQCPVEAVCRGRSWSGEMDFVD